MRHYHCADHSAFSLRPIFKRPCENDVHNICNFEAYFISANGREDWFPVNLLRLLKNLSGTDISQPGSRILRRPSSSLRSID